jgi:hypothetical protein
MVSDAFSPSSLGTVIASPSPGADSSIRMLRPSDVEALSQWIATLQRERQELRLARSSEAALERNRRELAEAQRAFSMALIDEYCEAARNAPRGDFQLSS